MRFDEFHPGQRIQTGPTRVEEADILAFAKAYDPQWFHTDPERARASRWNGLIASGWHTCAIAMRMVCEGPLAGSTSIGSPGLAWLKWSAPVRPGDELRLDAEVLETRRSRKGDIGVLRWGWRLKNQRGEDVLDTEVTSLFELETTDGAAAAS
jgi:acyl dehydratase